MKNLERGRYLLMTFLAMVLLLGTAGAEEIEPTEAPEPEKYVFDDPFIDLCHESWGTNGDKAVLLGTEEDPYEQMKQVLRGNLKLNYETIIIKNYTDQNLEVADLAKLYYNTLYDYPEDTYFARTAFSYYPPDNENYYIPNEDMYIFPEYLEEYDQTCYQRKVEQAADACFCAGMTPLEKVVSAHDWLVSNCQYDPYVANKNSTYTTTGGVVYNENERVYTSYGAFVDGNIVCQGYALAFKVLMDRAEVPCCFVKNSGHAWNMVQLDGKWYHVDTTWDDPVDRSVGDLRGYVSREYLAKSDTEFQTSHAAWTTEYQYATPADSYGLPEPLVNASTTAAYLIDGSFYLMSERGELYQYETGKSFADGRQIADISLGQNDVKSGACDGEAGRLYYSVANKAYELDLAEEEPAFYLLDLQLDSNEYLYLRDSQSFPGEKELCAWYDYTAGSFILVGVRSTAVDMPVVIQFPAGLSEIKNLPQSTILVKAGTLPEASTEGVLYLACYDAKGRLLNVSTLGRVCTGDQTVLKIENSPADTTAKVKIITVSDVGVPLASSIQST